MSFNSGNLKENMEGRWADLETAPLSQEHFLPLDMFKGPT